MLNLIEELKQCFNHNEKAVLATIIDTEGSTYRQTGAKSLFCENGKVTGVLSGGCVEQDIKEFCKEVIESGQARTVYYNFKREDPLMGFGVGCEGALTILLQPFDPIDHKDKAESILFYLADLHSETVGKHLITVTASEAPDQIPVGSQWFYRDNESIIYNEVSQKKLADNNYLSEKMEAVSTVRGKYTKLSCFVETARSLPSLIIFGAGADAQPLVDGAKLLNWHVTIVDHRPAVVESQVFTRADEIILTDARKVPDEIQVTSNSFTVVMSHHFNQDLAYLEHLVNEKPFYIGLLGSRKRSEKLLRELQTQGIFISTEVLDKLHYPVGLDIGAETPEEIAFSVLSEIMMKSKMRDGQPLKYKTGAIHSNDSSESPVSCSVVKESL